MLLNYVTSATNGERRAVATVFQNAIKNGLETVDLIASSDIGDYLGLQEGELFTARLNTAGEIKSGGITKVATINWGRAELLETGYGKASYSMHDVVSRSGAKIETEYGDVIVIPTKANIYVYNSVGSSPTRRVLAPEERHMVYSLIQPYDNNDNILDNVQMSSNMIESIMLCFTCGISILGKRKACFRLLQKIALKNCKSIIYKRGTKKRIRMKQP